MPDAAPPSARDRAGVRRRPPDDAEPARPRRGRLAMAERLLLAGAIVGGLLLIAADLTSVLRIESRGRVLGDITGGSRHDYALVLIGLLALVAAVGVASTRARPPMLALSALGLIAAAIALIGDLPSLHRTGAYGRGLTDATASAGVGFFLETLGAALLLVGGGALLLLSEEDADAEPRSEPPA